MSQEQQLIESIKAMVGTRFLGDDCALIAGGNLLSTDTLVEGTHFIIEKCKFNDIGWKAMAVNLSDIAAMAGRPRYALVAITMPPRMKQSDFTELYEGIVDCASRYRTTIVGGDITRGPVLVITITILGEVSDNGCLMRGGAQVGDVVVVTGHFGASRAGLALLTDSEAKSHETVNFKNNKFSVCLNQYFRPIPKLIESWAFVKHTGNRAALMDASDGLADALAQIASASRTAASHIGMHIYLDSVPIHDETKEAAKLFKQDCHTWALYGGEDFELVGCLPEPVWRSWQKAEPNSACSFKAIGKVTDSGKVELFVDDKPAPKLDLAKCFQHIDKPAY